MLIAIWAFNNITVYKLLTAHCGVPSNNYRHQTTKNFEKLLDLEGIENTLIINAPIFLVLHIHIEPTRFLEDGTLHAKFDTDGGLR